MWRSSVVAWLFVVGALTACTDAPTPQGSLPDASVGVTVSAAGATIQSDDGRVSLVIPPGALAQATRMSIRRASGAPAGAIGGAWELGPEGTVFAQPATLTLSYTAAELGSASPSSLLIGTVVNGAWVPRPFPVVVPSLRQVSVAIGHLSTYGVIPKPDRPCECDADAWRACCVGTVPSPCVCVETRLPFQPMERFVDCLATRAGSLLSTNFCNGCLRRCCAASQGYPTPHCACMLDTLPQAWAAIRCGLGCFATEADPVTLCEGAAPACEVTSGTYAGTLTGPLGATPISGLTVNVDASCQVRVNVPGAPTSAARLDGGYLRQQGDCVLTRVSDAACCDWHFEGDALTGTCVEHTQAVCDAPSRCAGTCHGLVCGQTYTYALRRVASCARDGDCPALNQCAASACLACRRDCGPERPCVNGTCATFGNGCARCVGEP